MRLVDADALLTDRRMRMYYHLPNGDIAVPVIDIEHAPTIEERKWIPCSERLPKEKREVLVSTKDGYLNIAFLETLSTGDLEWTDVIEYFQIPNVTAWMSLPEPYTEGNT